MIIRALRLRHGRIALPRRLHHPVTSHLLHIHTSSTRFSSALESTVTPNAEASERVGIPQFAATAKETIGPNTVVDRTVPLNDPNHPVALDYAFFQHNKKHTSGIGSTLAAHYKPHELLTKPPSPRDITLEALIAAQTHIGHATSLWNPSNARYIFGIRGEHDPIHIISPDATASHLRRACRVVSGVADGGGLILFVGTRQGQARAVVKAAELSKGCHLFSKWIPGSITNGQQILGRCEKRVKNEVDEDVTELYGFEDQLFAKAAIKPDLVVCMNPLENYVLLHECGLNNIPTVGIIDTDANPTWVTYPIPANDDSLRAVQFICGVLGRAGQEGQERRLRNAASGYVVYAPIHRLKAPREERSDRGHGNGSVAGSAELMQIKAKSARAGQSGAIEQSLPEEPLFPDDFEGADVSNHEQDRALLAQAERVLFDQDMESKDSDAIPSAEQMSGMDMPHNNNNNTNSASEPDSDSGEDVDLYASFNDTSEPDLSAMDQSLVDETYAQQSETVSDEDAAQFGVASKGAAGADNDSMDSQTSSPIDQVGEVEKELGEEAPEPEIGQKK